MTDSYSPEMYEGMQDASGKSFPKNERVQRDSYEDKERMIYSVSVSRQEKSREADRSAARDYFPEIQKNHNGLSCICYA